MRRITLSDHTADKAQQAQKRREDDYAARLAGYERERERKQQSVDEARSWMRTAWNDRRVMAALCNALVVRWRALVGWPKPPRMQAPSHEEHIWSIGNQGEAKVSDFQARQLDDDWVLVSGYRKRARRNRSGAGRPGRPVHHRDQIHQRFRGHQR